MRILDIDSAVDILVDVVWDRWPADVADAVEAAADAADAAEADGYSGMAAAVLALAQHLDIDCKRSARILAHLPDHCRA